MSNEVDTEVEVMDDEAYATALEALACYQSMYSRVGAIVSTKDPDSLRMQVQRELLRRYEATGADRVRPKVGGVTVGTMSITFTKEVPAKEVTRAVVKDPDALLADDNDEFSAFLAETIKRNLNKFAVEYAETTGELLEGMEWVTDVTPAQPATVKGVRLSVDDDKVDEGIERALMEGHAIELNLLGGE